MAADDLHRIAERYASALFSLADQTHALEAVEKDLNALSALLTESEALVSLIRNPLLPRAKKADALDVLLGAMKAAKLTRQFINTLALNQRLPALSAVIRQYGLMLSARRGETRAVITTAAPLSDAKARELAASLSKALGRKLDAEIKTDPSLIGGLTVEIGGTLIDDSIKNKLARMSRALKAA